MLKNKIISISVLILVGLLFMSCPLLTEEEEKKEETYSVKLIAQPSKYGTVNQSATIAKKGQTISITAIPNEGYVFSKWSGDFSGDTATASVTVLKNMNIIAEFQIEPKPEPVKTYKLTTTVEGDLNASISGNTSSEYNINTEVTLTANPSSGYKFLRWDGHYTSANGATAIVKMDMDKTVTAVFASVNSTVYTIKNTQSDFTMGDVKLDTETLVESGSKITITAIPAAGYKLVGWTGIAEQTNPVTVTVTHDMNIAPIFETKPYYTVTVTSNDPNFGTVSSSSTSVIENGGFTIKATPKQGYRFYEWQGDYIGEEAEATIYNVTSDMNIQAVYKSDQWNVLVHFAVDNDIDYSFEKNYRFITNYIQTLQSIEALDRSSNADSINILLLLDSYNNDPNGNGYSSTFRDGYYLLSGDTDLSNLSNDLIVPKEEINSGDPKETKDFIDWAISQFPKANRTMYSVFNHGGGFNDDNSQGTQTYGIGFDNSANNDALSHDELYQTTKYLKDKIGKNIDLIFPYACLMGGVELAYELKDNADYILFSEELYPADYWSYEALSTIVSNSSISSEQLGIAFCNYADFYFNITSQRDFTLSLVDLSKMDDLYNSINSYSQAAINEIYNRSGAASDFNNIAMSSLKMMEDKMYYYIDLGDYLKNIKNSNLNNSIISAATNVETSLDNSTIYHSSNIPNSTGMTIYHNIWNSTSQYSSNTYKEILDFGTNSWANYIILMDDNAFNIQPDEYEFDDNSDSATELIKDGGKQIHNHHSSNDIDYIKINESKSDYYRLSIINESGSNNSNIITHVYDPNENYVTSFPGYRSLDLFHPYDGPIYLKVVPVDISLLSDYSVSLETIIPPQVDSYENNDSFDIAKTMSINSPQYHSFHYNGDVDYIKINLTSGKRYKIETYEDINGTDCDTKLYLYDSSFIEIKYNDDKEESLYSKVVFDCTTTDTYYIKVVEFSDELGNYKIDLTETTESLSINSNDTYQKPQKIKF